jgi:hypothetical protein
MIFKIAARREMGWWSSADMISGYGRQACG